MLVQSVDLLVDEGLQDRLQRLQVEVSGFQGPFCPDRNLGPAGTAGEV